MGHNIHEACLLLGSNIDAQRKLPEAIGQLSQHVEIVKISDAWQSAPVGMEGDDFLNAALLIKTDKEMHALKYEVLRPIEKALGRTRTDNRFIPRTMDIDIVIFDDRVIDDDLWDYPHIAVPAAQLAPDFSDDTKGLLLRKTAQRYLEQGDITLRDDLGLSDDIRKGNRENRTDI